MRHLCMKLLILAAVLVSLVGAVGASEAQTLCTDRDENLRCLRKQFEPLYQNSPDRFWRILNRSRDIALQCRSTSKTLEFLQLVEVRSGNAEFNEYLSETMEGMCAQKPACIARAAAKLGPSAKSLLREKLMRPEFFDLKKSEISRCVPH